MKYILATLMMMSAQHVFAADTFGGLSFDRDIPKKQKQLMKEDLKFLFQLPTGAPDTEFQRMTGLKNLSGPEYHNWIINRSRYVVSEDRDIKELMTVEKEHHKYDKPLEIPSLSRLSKTSATTVMTNLAGALYIVGKQSQSLLGFKFDRSSVRVTSPRIGLLQIGEGLFLERLSINKDMSSTANKINRLATLMHESRHSDGNGKHIAFLHTSCPMGHSYAKLPACDASSNGPYTIDSLFLKQMLQQCDDCSLRDKLMLQALIADSASRTVVPTSSGRDSSLDGIMISTINLILKTCKQYPDLKSCEPQKIRELQAQLAELQNPQTATVAAKAPEWDPAPEGSFKNYTLKESQDLMKKDLKK